MNTPACCPAVRPTLPRVRAAGLRAAAALCLAASSLSAQAADLPTAETLERGLAGAWRGALVYRDYRSNRQFELPMSSRIQVGPDGATLTRLSTFDDGPQTGWVHITSVSLFDATGLRVSTAMFRKGRPVDLSADEARVSAYRDAEHWTIVYRQRGQDDKQPADIRVTQVRDGDTLTAVKEVGPVGAGDDGFQVRNQTRLQRVAGP